MKLAATITFILFFRPGTSAQQPVSEPVSELNTNQLEEIAEDDENETENDYEVQQLSYFAKHPIDINGTELGQLPLLHPLLIHNLAAYRKSLGDIIHLHELQAVPGFTVEIINSILPYVTIRKDAMTSSELRDRFTKGEHSFLIRSSFVPEVTDGFRSSSSQQFAGSRPALFLRYKYQFQNVLQYGVTADKDAGEKILTKNRLPDFTSFHFFARNIGIVKSVALGDYTINLGQGLIHWQSQAFHKSSTVLNIKRQSEVLRPYHSAGEFNFHRGIAVTASKHSTEVTLFISRKNLTANTNGNAITSIITSGLHRTEAELADKNQATLFTAGGQMKRQVQNGHIGLNGVYYRYSLPIMKNNYLYNLFSLHGKEWRNVSADYSFTHRYFHFFGEVAADQNWSCAYINGVMASLSKSVDLAILHRYFNKRYQSVFGNAFTENTMPANEYGFYTGVTIKPALKWKVDLYADIFSFPWLKYRLDAPSSGYAYLMQVSWKPDKQTEIYSRFRYRIKPLNIEHEEEGMKSPGIQIIQQWRTHISRQLSRTILLRSRVEVCLFSHQFMNEPETGYLFYTDILFKPFHSLISGSVRFQAFEANSYDTRIYAYENDLLFVSSTPAYYNNGVRCYLNIKAKSELKFLSNRMLTVNLKLATTVYNNVSEIGTGPAHIRGNRISAAKLQLFLAEE